MREWSRIMALPLDNPLHLQLREAVSSSGSPNSTPLHFLSSMCLRLHKHLDDSNMVIGQRVKLSPAAIVSQRVFDEINIFDDIEIGKSGERTPEEMANARERMDQFQSYFHSHDTAIAFCDGSQSESGTGSAAVLEVNGYFQVEMTRRLPTDSSNLDAEMEGLLLAFELAVQNLNYLPSLSHLIIVTDCYSALQIMRTQKDFAQWGSIFQSVWKLDNLLLKNGITSHLAWCPSHCGIVLNEVADTAAKNACRMLPPVSCKSAISVEKCKTSISKFISTEWQKRWAVSPSGAFTRMLIPSVSFKIAFPINRSSGISIARALLNNAGVADNLYRMGLSESPNCPECFSARQTVSHVILECPKYRTERNLLSSKLPVGSLHDLSVLAPNQRGLSKAQRKSLVQDIHLFMSNISI